MKNCLLILILLVTLVLPSQSYAQVILKTDSIAVPCTFMDTILVPVRVANFTNVGAMQFSLDWDTAQLDFVTVTPLNPVFSNSALFGFDVTTYIAQGNLTFVWYKNGGLTVPDNTVVFSVGFVRQGGAFAAVKFSNLPIEIVVGDNSPNPQPLPFETINGGLFTMDTQAPTISCPANLTVQSNGSVVINNIPPQNVQDDCGPATVGWTSTGSTTVNAPTDPDASGTAFNPGSSTVRYTATDATGNTASCSFSILVESDSLVTLTIDTILGSCQSPGQQVAVDISVRGFLDIIGLQFSVEWDETVLQFDSVGNVWPGLNLNITNYPGIDTSAADGLLRFFGGNGSTGWPDIPNDSAFFTIYFTVLNANGTSDLTFIPPFDAVNTDFNSVPIQTINGFYTSADLAPPVFTGCPANTTVNVTSGLCTANLQPAAATAVDTCSGLAGISSNHPLNNTFSVGTTTVTYTATDNAGNTATCTRLVTVVENVPPILECPDNVSVNAAFGTTTANVTGLQPVALLDNCPGNINLTYVRTGATSGSGVGNANGTYNAINTTVTYTATDASGNSSTCSFNVMVDAGEPLVLLLDSVDTDCYFNGQQLEVNLTVENFTDIFGLQFSIAWNEGVLQLDSVGNGFPGLNLNTTNFPGLDTSAADGLLRFFGGNGTSGYPDIPDDNIFFTLYYTVLNGNNATDILFIPPFDAVTFDPNTTTFSSVPVQTYDGVFASVDLTAPVITSCPPNLTVTANGSECNVNVTLPLVQANDNCSGLDTILSSHPSSVYSVGITTVIYTVSDVAGNTTTCTVIVTVGDSIPPIFTSCPPDVLAIAPSSACSTTVQWVNPNATDACSNTGLTLTSNFTEDSLFTVGSTMVTYVATDMSGNTSTCTFLVVVQDTTAPVVQCPGDTTVMATGAGCTATVNLAPPTGTDNCDNTLDFESDPAPGTPFPAGVTIVTYTATDDFINISTCSFEVTVEGNAAPVLTCPQDTTQGSVTDTCGTTVCWLEPLVTFGCDTNLTITSNYQPCDFFGLGTTAVVYTATDISGNSATCAFNVSVTESLPPIFLNCPDVMVFNLPAATCDTALTLLTPAVTDNCAIDTVTNNVPASFPAGTTTIIYTATDVSGNSAICSFEVIVIDPIAPVLSSCPPSDTISTTDCSAILTYVTPTATDNCDPNPTITAQPPSGTPLAPGSVNNVLILAEDGSENTDTCIFTITVQGSGVPGFTGSPADITVSNCAAVATWTPPVPVGFCTPPEVTSNYNPGDVFPVGTTAVIYIAVDTTDLIPTQTDTFYVTVVPDGPPTIACPVGTIVVNTGGAIVTDLDAFLGSVVAGGDCNDVQLNFGPPLAIDSCGLEGITQVSGPPSGNLFGIGLDSLIFVAVDSSGNEATCAIYVEIVGLPVLNIVVSPDPGCSGDTLTLSVVDIPGAVYVWNGPLGPLPDNSTITIPNLGSSGTGLYSVSATVGACDLALDTATVVMATDPDANDDLDFEIDPNGVDTFNVLTNDILIPPTDFVIAQVGNPLPGLTDLGNGLFLYVATGQSGKASFIYEVCSKSCPDLCAMATVTITIRDKACSFIPNIISPNGDGVNDFLEIPCLDSDVYTGNSLVVYNQWGGKVFEAEPYSNDHGSAWQGTLNGEVGKDLPDGVYFYIFKPAPSDPPIKGFVEIFR